VYGVTSLGNTQVICSSVLDNKLHSKLGGAIARAVNHRLPNVVTQVRIWVRSRGICGRQSGTGASYFGFP
jgi:hypothetical protein